MNAYLQAAAILGGTYAAVAAVLVVGPVAAGLAIVAILAAIVWYPKEASDV